MLPANTIHVQDRDPDHETNFDLQMIPVSRCPAKPVEWLWPNRIPIGKVTLLCGDPGLGKSLVALDIAARVSTGAAWPDENDETQMTNDESPSSPSSSFNIRHSSFPLSSNPQSENNGDASAPSSFDIRHSSFPPSSVLILSAEDDLDDTIRPRLDAAGADCDRISFIPTITDLRDDFHQLELAVKRAPNCRLIIIDPINAYVGSGDSHFHTVVHKVLAPLAKLAHERRIAILAIAHVRKTDGAAIFRATGSAGFVAGARAVWTVCRDPDQPDRNLFMPLKTNVAGAAAARGLAYKIEPHPDLPGPVLVWDATPPDLTTAEALKPRKPPRPPSPEREAARDWIQKSLADGPRPAGEILKEGTDRGFLERTLRRAFHEMQGHTKKEGLHEGWWWSLDEKNDPKPTTCRCSTDVEPQKTAVPFEAVTYEADIAAQKLQAQVLANEKPSSTPVAPVSHTGNPIVDRSIAALDNLHRLREGDREYFAAHPPQCATACTQAVPHSNPPMQPEPQKPVPPRSTKPELNYAFFDQLITALEQTIANSPLAA